MTIQATILLLAGIIGFLYWGETMALHMMEQRRGFITRAVPAAAGIYAAFNSPFVGNTNNANIANAAGQLVFSTSVSGGKQFQYADAKLGEGDPKKVGDPVVINYVMSSTGLSNGVKIYSTQDSGVPYQWVLGDKSTIAGLEQAVAGGDGVPPMLPGGIRRVIIAGASSNGYDVKECADGRGPGPVPRGETYGRFKNTFCNPTRPDSPELVLDVKLLLPSQISTYVLTDE
mmetsp:Transcript_47565/g.54940  ORF Transcript_47565/g.54940 Transcript_47565/m.54940 type:complete len:230 (+) Transcript_47565:91-780(+)|eukprot:CAMPEP_0170766616 /NCGR_PEP_ID=MMETSP0733-20121128/5256_1 /TAXON_ID=186038 /ORGANISM="Fragilariopsis kerguelensis, Strain L26-C5" /LENGTH=229 /DNA_ID=CAMNT_0011107591 /DNA_START=69 /DNA_END=758 /DNA_ORIENTATION=-